MAANSFIFSFNLGSYKNDMYKINKSPYQYFLLKFIIFFAIVVILDFTIGSLLRIFYFKQDSGLLYRTTYSIEKTTADLLIFGSSTANHGYHPSVFKNRIRMSFYNVGRDGTPIFYHYAVLEAVLNRYTPKMIIYNFDAHEFSKNQESYDILSFLLPYYEKHPEIRPIVNLRSPYEKYKLLSKIYPYNSSIFTIAIGNTELNKRRRGDIDGYVPLTTIWNEPIRDGNTFIDYKLDSNKIKTYESFIKDCINLKIKLYVVCPPLFIKPNYTSSSIILGKKITDKFNIKFLDFSKDSAILNDAKLFADVGHLNNEGAYVFSNKIIDSILTETQKY
jgi:hypothetical protein